MKILRLFIVAAWVTGAVGCAAPGESKLNPKVSSVAECDAVQKKTLEFDRQEQGRLLRSLAEMSIDMKVTSVDQFENCLLAGPRIECDSRWCRVFEKYFTGNDKK